MAIYTSYFSNPKLKDDINKDKIVHSITAKPPKWFNGINIDEFAPSKELLSWYKSRTEEERQDGKVYETYAIRYIESLKERELRDVIDYLTSCERDVVLLCYEVPEDFCHRHLLAEYLKENYGLIVTELSNR